MRLEPHPQFELQAASKAFEGRAAAALEALLATARQRCLWARWEWKFRFFAGAPLLHGNVRESAAQLLQALLGPELPAIRGNSGLQPSFVCQVSGKETQKLKVVPAKEGAARFGVHYWQPPV